MAIYHDLDNTGQEVQQRLDQVPVTQADLAEEVLARQAAVGAVQNNVDAEELRAKAAEKLNADDIDAIEEKIPSGASSSNKMATASDISSLDAAIEAILLLIPSAATSLNKLADKAFVNSSIATATATFRGTKNLVSDLNLAVDATHEQIAVALSEAVSADNNDYAFVQVPTSDATPTQIAKTERYKFNGTAWEYEYDLNNSGYTADQWAAINSGITAALVSKLSALPTNAELTTALGLLSDGIASINGKIPSEATTSNKLVDTAAMQSYVTQIINAIDATFNVASADGHVTVQITQVNGVITNVVVTTSDIASAAALTLVTGRVTDAEANIVSLGGRMTTAEDDIDDLQQLYNNLQQSAPVVIEPTDTWPVAVADRSATVIYRVVDRVNTPPQYYSDYMFRASDLSGQPVLMGQYDNAIDPRPKKGSQNLVTSGGVFDNMGALDISELNATENPHTLTPYVDLSAALAAIPSDYQKGGMSIKFVQGSVQSNDNKYVQYRLMSDTFNTTKANWQGVDDEPTAGSDNLVKSGGVKDITLLLDINDVEGESGTIYVNGNKTSNSSYKRWFFDNDSFNDLLVVGRIDQAFALVAFYNSETPNSDSLIAAYSGMGTSYTKEYTLVVPSNCKVIGISTTVASIESEITNFKVYGSMKGINHPVTDTIASGVNEIPDSDTVYKALTDPSNGFVDDTLTDNSTKLVRSGVVKQAMDGMNDYLVTGKSIMELEEINGWVDSSKVFVMNNYGKHKVVKINKDKPFLRVKSGANVKFVFFVVDTYTKPTASPGNVPDFSEAWPGYNSITKNTVEVLDLSASDANYIVFNCKLNSGNVDFNPAEFEFLSEYDLSVVGGEWYDGDSQLENRIIQLQRRQNENKNYSTHPKILSLLHFSDLHNGVIDANHNNLMQLERLLSIADKYSDYINDIVCTGDMVDYYDDPFDFWANAGADKVLISLGNHEDVWVEKDPVTGEVIYPVVSHRDTTISQQMMYEKYFAPFVSSHTGVVQSENKVYWYKDYTNEKIRLISVYNYLYFVDSDSKAGSTAHAEQLTWFENVLADARANNLSVVLLNHFPIGLERVTCNFTKNDIDFSLGITNFDDFMDRIEAFKTVGGEFICHLVGHMHQDGIGYKETYPNQIFISVVNASLENIYSDFTRVRGERCQDAFNIISFDTYTKHIKIVRVGANVDYCMRDRNAICINYQTKQILSQS